MKFDFGEFLSKCFLQDFSLYMLEYFYSTLQCLNKNHFTILSL